MNRIYVEGREKLFIEALLKKEFGSEYGNETIVIKANGWQRLDLLKQEFSKSMDEGGQNLIIFDADTTLNGGSFDVRKTQIEDICTKLGYQSKLFLLPNNQDNGDYETLLEKLVNPKHRLLLECFSKYENCVSNNKDEQGNNIYVVPARKAKIYSYVDAFKKSRNKAQKFRDGDWFFDDVEYWTIDKNPEIEPLIEFLKANITKK